MTGSACHGAGGHEIANCVSYSVLMGRQSLSVFVHE